LSTVLVTGASGFIGRSCLPLLLEAGFEVDAVSAHARTVPVSPNIRWHQADLLDSTQAGALMKRLRPSYLLHLAWYAVPELYWTSSENVAWQRASADFLRDFAAKGGTRAVVAGTCAEYDWSQGVCVEATTPLLPTTPYGAAKHALQGEFEALRRSTGLSGAWGRIFFPYGPHEHRDRLVPSIIRSFLADKPALCTSGDQRRDFLHVYDVAGAFVSLLKSAANGAFNIGTGEAVSIREIAGRIARQMNREELLRLGALPPRENDPPLVVADAQRLRDETGWKPGFELDQGIEQAIAWWRAQAVPGGATT
jgi:nucleoside-diphosphate-sugar epimerase